MAAAVLISPAEYARRRGVAKSSVSRAILSGRITAIERDGKLLLDPEVADIQWEKNTEAKFAPPRRPAVAPPAAALPAADDPAAPVTALYDRAAAAAKRETHEANLAAMREAKEAGALVDRERVQKAATDAGALLRTALERLPGLAVELAPMTDPAAIQARLSAAVADALADLADNLRRMAGSAAGEGDDGSA